MAEQEEDFSNLPLSERFAHKNWKVRKEAYETATTEFREAKPNAPIIKDFIHDSGLWKAALSDSNVAAQQEALNAYCAFLEIAGREASTRTRSYTVTPIVEKGLTGRPAAKAAALEALMLLIDLDKPDPVIEELLPHTSHKQPKISAATLAALTAIYHAYGVRTIEPKPIIMILPKAYGHADKNVRAEAQNLTVELYRWLKDAMKKLFWNDLKPVQQTDLEKLFDNVRDDPPPKQERLLRSQQAAVEAQPEDMPEEVPEEEEEPDIDLEPEVVAVDVFPKLPKDLNDRLNSTKWKDRKEVLEDVFAVVNQPALQEGPFDEIIRGLAKSMKDSNIAVVTIAANVVEAIALGLKKSFAKYRSTIVGPMLERLKEKKQSVTDALANALDAVAAATTIQDNIEEIFENMKHKNPTVKLETARFLSRSLKATRKAPDPPEAKPIAEAAIKLLAESQETIRSAGAEILGVLWKIMGDKNMLAFLDPLDDIKKAKVKEYCDQAEVKSKWKPKAAPAPKPAAAAPASRKPALGKRPAPGLKKAAPPARRPASPDLEPEEPPAAAPLAARPTSRPASKLAPKPGLQRPALGGLKKPASALASPRRPAPVTSADDEPPTPVAAPRAGIAAPGRGLAGRPLGKPNFAQGIDTPPSDYPPPSPSRSSTLSNAERSELSDLRSEVEYLRQQNSDLRTDKLKLNSQIHELQDQNAQLIEDHTRDMLGIKAKETQLVRARSDAEAAEEKAATLAREVDRLKREVGRLGRQDREDAYANEQNGIMNGSRFDGGIGGIGGGYGSNAQQRTPYGSNRGYQPSSHPRNADSVDHTSSTEGKENVPEDAPAKYETSLEQPTRRISPTYGGGAGHARQGSTGPGSREQSSSGRGSPASSLGGPTLQAGSEAGARASLNRTGSDGVESWRRAAEVTQNLKARIEMMKVSLFYVPLLETCLRTDG